MKKLLTHSTQLSVLNLSAFQRSKPNISLFSVMAFPPLTLNKGENL